jgi:DNA replication protein DnaC
LTNFDFSCVPALNKQLVLDLARGEYIQKVEPVLMVGNPGLGKPQPIQYPDRFDIFS